MISLSVYMVSVPGLRVVMSSLRLGTYSLLVPSLHSVPLHHLSRLECSEFIGKHVVLFKESDTSSISRAQTENELTSFSFACCCY